VKKSLGKGSGETRLTGLVLGMAVCLRIEELACCEVGCLGLVSKQCRIWSRECNRSTLVSCSSQRKARLKLEQRPTRFPRYRKFLPWAHFMLNIYSEENVVNDTERRAPIGPVLPIQIKKETISADGITSYTTFS
jgi:hypothetical protein